LRIGSLRGCEVEQGRRKPRRDRRFSHGSLAN
jgi:hypothetical protein